MIKNEPYDTEIEETEYGYRENNQSQGPNAILIIEIIKKLQAVNVVNLDTWNPNFFCLDM